MVLVVTLAVLTLAFTAAFWGLSLFLQGYLYSMPASRLPLRALTAGLAVACFLTMWTYFNTRAESENKLSGSLRVDETLDQKDTQPRRPAT